MALVPFLLTVPSPGEAEACPGGSGGLPLFLGPPATDHLQGSRNWVCPSSLSPLWHKRLPEARKWLGSPDTNGRECQKCVIEVATAGSSAIPGRGNEGKRGSSLPGWRRRPQSGDTCPPVLTSLGCCWGEEILPEPPEEPEVNREPGSGRCPPAFQRPLFAGAP